MIKDAHFHVLSKGHPHITVFNNKKKQTKTIYNKFRFLLISSQTLKKVFIRNCDFERQLTTRNSEANIWTTIFILRFKHKDKHDQNGRIYLND